MERMERPLGIRESSSLGTYAHLYTIPLYTTEYLCTFGVAYSPISYHIDILHRVLKKKKKSVGSQNRGARLNTEYIVGGAEACGYLQ
jgi:hypothetical protein